MSTSSEAIDSAWVSWDGDGKYSFAFFAFVGIVFVFDVAAEFYGCVEDFEENDFFRGI